MANFTGSAAFSTAQLEENELCNWVVVCSSDDESDGVISLDDYDFNSSEVSSVSDPSENHRNLDLIVDLDVADQSTGSIQDLDEADETQTLGSSIHGVEGIVADESIGLISDLGAVHESLSAIQDHGVGITPREESCDDYGQNGDLYADLVAIQEALGVFQGSGVVFNQQEVSYDRYGQYGGGFDQEEEEEDDDAGDEGYGLDDELIPWTVSGKFGRQRMRKLGKRACAKMNTTKKLPHLYVKSGCVRGKHQLGSRRNY